MTCPGPADMSTCDRKQRCIFGGCEGQAYNPSDPCPNGGNFNAATCECTQATPYRGYNFYWDDYCYFSGGFGFIGNECCQGYNLASGRAEGPVFRDFGALVSLTGFSVLGNTKAGWVDEQSQYTACRPMGELTYADAGYGGSYVEAGPFGSFGSYVPADQKVYQEATDSGGCTSRGVIEARNAGGSEFFLVITSGICGSVECVIPDCTQNVRAVPRDPSTGLEVPEDTIYL